MMGGICIMKKTLFFLLLIYAQSLYSQTTSDSSHLLFSTLGFGSYRGEKSSGLDFQLSLDYQKKNYQWKFRYIGASEFQLFGPDPPESYNDIGVLYGRVANAQNIQLSLSGGLGIVAGTMRGDYISSSGVLFPSSQYETKHVFTVGIPLEAAINYNPFKSFGLGFAVYANLNAVNSFWGINLMFKVGTVKHIRRVNQVRNNFTKNDS